MYAKVPKYVCKYLPKTAKICKKYVNMFFIFSLEIQVEMHVYVLECPIAAQSHLIDTTFTYEARIKVKINAVFHIFPSLTVAYYSIILLSLPACASL